MGARFGDLSNSGRCPDLGNSVQNSNVHQVNANLEMQTFMIMWVLKNGQPEAAAQTIEETQQSSAYSGSKDAAETPEAPAE